MAVGRRVDIVIGGDADGGKRAFRETENAADGFGSKMGGIGGIVGTAGTAIAGFAAAAVVAIGAVVAAGAGVGLMLLDIGAQFDDAYDHIRITTGATGGELSGLQDDLRAIMEDTPSSMDEISTAIAGINQMLGLTGEPLQTLARQVLDLSRITGTDLGGNLAATTDLINNWNVAAGYQSAALDLLFKIGQETGVPFEKLASDLAENGIVLRELGFSLPESAALFGTLAKAGLDAGDVMPALTKSLAAAANAGVSATDLVAQTWATIADAPNATAAAQSAIDVFGAKAGPKLAALIREGKLSYEDLLASVTGSGETIQGAAADTDDWGEKWTIFRNKLTVALEPVATTVFDALGTAMEGLLPQVDRLVQWFADNPQAISDFAAKVQEAIQWIIDNAPGFVDQVIEWAGTVGDFLKGVSEWWTEHGDTVMAVLGAVVAVLGWAGSNMLTIIGWVVTAFQWVWDKVEGFVNWLTETAVPWIQNFATTLYFTFVGIKDTVVGIWDSIWQKIEDFIGFVQGIPGRIGDALYGMWDGLKNGIVDALNYVIWKWNGLSFSTPDVPGTDWGGVTIDTPDIDYISYHTGTSSVQFPGGAPEGPVMLRRGEQVITPNPFGQSGGGRGDVFVAVEVTGSAIVARVTDHQRSGARVPWVKADR